MNGYPLGHIRVYDRGEGEQYQLRPRADLTNTAFSLATPKPPRRKVAKRAAPVTVTNILDGVDPRLHAEVLRLAAGNLALIRIISYTHVRILDDRYPGGPR